jgi:Coenzyme F420-dependent N5,N10-methylene tetrahydromethanopterin reductase and related flavin-dependent oxidoreductases
MRPFFGYHMPSFTFAGAPDSQLFGRVVELAQTAEAAGVDLVTVMDHFYQIGPVGSEEEPMLEAYTLLGGIAAKTKRVMLGTMVTGVTYRNPAILAKTVTTLDIVSGGRAVLGIGAAWNDVEHAGYGIEFPAIGEREDRLEEALTICKAMFTEERPSFEGAITASIVRGTTPGRSGRAGPGSWSAAAARSEPSRSLPGSRTSPTGSAPSRRPRPSWRSWTAIARRSAATRPRSCARSACRSFL